jgi:hypothetical protein
VQPRAQGRKEQAEAHRARDLFWIGHRARSGGGAATATATAASAAASTVATTTATAAAAGSTTTQSVPTPTPTSAHAVAPAKQPRAPTNHTGLLHALPAASSSCGSGVDDDGQCDGGEFTLDTAPVVAEAAVGRKEIRRVRPLLSGLQLQVPEWQGRAAGSGQ